MEPRPGTEFKMLCIRKKFLKEFERKRAGRAE